MPTLDIKRPKCKCVAKVDALLKERHTRVVTTLFGGLVGVRSEVTDDAPKRTKAVSIIASFCPFCGKEYPKNETKVAKPNATTQTTR